MKGERTISLTGELQALIAWLDGEISEEAAFENQVPFSDESSLHREEPVASDNDDYRGMQVPLASGNLTTCTVCALLVTVR